MAVVEVKSTDVGAIQLSGQDGSLAALFDKHLVTDGGFTKPYTNGSNGGNYCPPGHTRGFHLDDAAAVSGSAALSTIRGFVSSSAFNTLVDPYPTIALKANTLANVVKSSTANSTTRRWWMLRGQFTSDLDSFIFLVVETSSTASECFFYGKVYPSDPTDPYCWMIWIRGSSSLFSTSLNIGTGTISTGTDKIYWERSKNGLVTSTTAFIPLAYGTANVGIIPSGPAYPPTSGIMEMLPIPVGCTGSQSTSSTIANATLFRGWLPSLWQLIHGSYSSVTNADTAACTSYHASSLRRIFGVAFSASTLSTGVIATEIGTTWLPPRY